MDNSIPEAFVLMKAGSHEGECLDCIIKRKLLELNGPEKRILWGYGGNRLLPERVQCFAEQWDNVGGPIQLLMPLTRAEERARQKGEKNPEAAYHQCQPKLHRRREKYSKDGNKWNPIQSAINVPVSKYALVLGKIKPVHMKLDRQEFKVGAGPSKGHNAAKYGGKYWFDHVCLVNGSPYGVDDPLVTIAYQASIVEPYAVFLD